MLTILTSLLSGGLTGILGGLISNVTDYLKQKQKNTHDLAVMAEDRKTMQMEIEGRERVASIEAEAEMDVAESQAFATSYSADRATYSDGKHPALAWVDVARGLVRPVLTVALVVFVGILWGTTDDPEMEQRIVATVLYITTTAVLWWFGTRNKGAK